jgi:uncharacterized membrane protein
MIAALALIVAVRALNKADDAASGSGDRLKRLEGEVLDLKRQLRKIEAAAPRATEAPAPPIAADSPELSLGLGEPRPGPARPIAPLPVRPPAPPAAPLRGPGSGADAPAYAAAPKPAMTPPVRPTVDLEQLIGARWATWIGVLAIVFAVALLLRWTFENNVIGPRGRVALGLLSGAALLGSGLTLHRRRWVPYLSEGLSGGGLAILYLSLFAAHRFYGFLDAGTAFGLMFLVTLLGSAVSVVTGRQVTAVLAILGGLLTPLLVATPHPDERVLLAYLLVLDILVLAVARFRSWPGLNHLAFVGTALLVGSVTGVASPHPLARLVLLTGLFALFFAVPLIRAFADRRRSDQLDLALVVATAATYFGAVYVTLEPWRPESEGPWALVLAAVYALAARAYEARVSDDEVAPAVLLGNAAILFTIAIPLALDGPWVTLAWAAQGVLLLAVASRLPSPNTVVLSGLMTLLLALVRATLLDPSPGEPRIWNAVFAVHLIVVAALALSGAVASRSGLKWKDETVTGADLRAGLWFAAAALLALLLWREPTGLWPGGLLAIEVLGLVALASRLSDESLVWGALMVAAALVLRVWVADDAPARLAARIANPWLGLRALACVALAVAGARAGDVSSKRAWAQEPSRVLGAAAAVLGLVTLSQAWVYHQVIAIRTARDAGDLDAASRLEWARQVGLSVLWTVYAAAALAWGFLRAEPWVRYAALALLGVVVLKVFFVDLAQLEAIYRILSFLVLGLALLGVSVLYQRIRRAPAER